MVDEWCQEEVVEEGEKEGSGGRTDCSHSGQDCSNFLDKSKLGVNNLQSNVAGYQNCSAAEAAGRKNQNRLENNSLFQFKL